MSSKRIAMVASEVAPFAKTGGLADVVAVEPGGQIDWIRNAFEAD